MENIICITTAKEMLFDGDEENIYTSTFTTQALDGELKFNLNDFSSNMISRLKDYLGSNLYHELLTNTQFSELTGSGKICTGEDDLYLYYLPYINYLILLSFGEIQPLRYRLYLEGIWNLGTVRSLTL